MTQDYIAGLDIGTTKICTVIAKANSGSEILDIAGVGTVPARGVSKGSIVDLNQAAASIQESIQAANHMAGFRIKKALVGVTGGHINACNLKGGVSISVDGDGYSAIVSQHDIARAFESATIRVAPEREILHLVPRRFSLDGEAGIEAPLGMNASRLEAEIHLVTAASNSLKNVIECTTRAGIKTEALVLEPIATSEAVSSADERKMGVAIIDIGGGTSDISVFSDGALHTTAIVSVGGNHVTRDISIGMRTPFDIAERLKIESGAITSSLQRSHQPLEVLSAGRDGERGGMPKATLVKIIAPRMTELFELARDAMHCNQMRKQLPAGIILTGGGALMPGAVELAQQVFGLPVHLGSPSGMTGWADRVNSPKFATAVGLLHYARRMQNDAYAFAELPGQNDSVRRVWGVPIAFDSSSKHSEQKDEKIFFDSSTPSKQAALVRADGTEIPNISEIAKTWWHSFNRSIQPAVDRVRHWLGFDVE